ncbi:MAG: hypothetical protein EXS14_06280 [Planctomycetes bacterium]|nr:hypothetical protein [Planctomycetota bacterium]
MFKHLVILTLLLTSARAQEPPPPTQELPPGFEVPESAADAPTSDASTERWRAALEIQRKGRWSAAQKAMRAVLEDFPTSVHKRSLEQHSDDNAWLGLECLHRGGPAERRIDVTVMGDGFTIDNEDQQLQEKWARLCLDVLCSEKSFGEYRSYFNFWFVRLASLEEGVDPNLSPEEKRRIEERNKGRSRKRKTEFSTALDCKAAGPQGQVMADPRLVRFWMRVAANEEPAVDDDGYAIAFARFGVLGMGGGGIANVGRPDRSVTVHEFGHAFVGLLDEYAVNPTLPVGPIRAPNASRESDPAKVPWAHFLVKKIANVGVFEGGATYQKGVWRPARTCAMNSAGHTGFCPVCREAAILRIYGHVSPIDLVTPMPDMLVRAKVSDETMLSITPMKPLKHDLKVTWYVERLADDTVMKEPDATAAPAKIGDGYGRRGEAFARIFGRIGGKRGREDRAIYDLEPMGEVWSLPVKKRLSADGPWSSQLPVGKLKPGRYWITAVVEDTTTDVLLDPKHLLQERASWPVIVQ